MYTYVEMSLRVPWALYFVFLALIAVPFAVMVLASGAGRGRFLSMALPVILSIVFAVISLYVLNAFEVTELMKTQKRAGPTLLTR